MKRIAPALFQKYEDLHSFLILFIQFLDNVKIEVYLYKCFKRSNNLDFYVNFTSDGSRGQQNTAIIFILPNFGKRKQVTYHPNLR